MRIAQVAPLHEAVPPPLYGGTERIVSYLTEELVRRGHQVTLYASGDSSTAAELVPCAPHALRLDPTITDPLALHYVMLERVFADLERFDVVHFHVDYLHFPWSARRRFKHVTTTHGRLDLPELQPLHRLYRGMPLVSISAAQRQPLPFAEWLGTVHHGLPLELFAPGYTPRGYLAFVGRTSPEKRVDRAIDIAIRARMPIKIAAKLDRSDARYYEEVVAPLIRHPLVEFIGEVGQADKQRLLAGASALLLPIDWPEPFGLVTIEAMACGAPVIAWRNGAIPELVEDGVTGMVIDSIEEGVRAVKDLPSIDRAACRRAFERRFSVARMTSDYLRIYERLLAEREELHGRRHPDP